MKTNKISIYIFLTLSILSFILSIVFTITLEDKILSWSQGFNFALFGSSLISIFQSIINYKVNKRNYSEKISCVTIHMSEDSQTELYLFNNGGNIENIVRIISICSKYCNDILTLLNSYKDGLFIFNIKEKRSIDDFMYHMQTKQLYEYRKFGTQLKEGKKPTKDELLNLRDNLDTLLKDKEIKKFVKDILEKNKSNITIKSDKKDSK